MDAHGGSLSVHSEGEGFGTKFMLQFPVERLTRPLQNHLTQSISVSRNQSNRIHPFERLQPSEASNSRRSSHATMSRIADGVRRLSESISYLTIRNSIYGALNASNCDPKLPKILVVDDAPLNRTMLIRLLRTRCSSSMEAENGLEAVEKLRQSIADGVSFDVILMDSCMPVMDGPTATRLIREMGFEGLIFGVTGNALPEDVASFKASGANDVFIKPLNILLYDNAIELNKKKE